MSATVGAGETGEAGEAPAEPAARVDGGEPAGELAVTEGPSVEAQAASSSRMAARTGTRSRQQGVEWVIRSRFSLPQGRQHGSGLVAGRAARGLPEPVALQAVQTRSQRTVATDMIGVAVGH